MHDGDVVRTPCSGMPLVWRILLQGLRWMMFQLQQMMLSYLCLEEAKQSVQSPKRFRDRPQAQELIAPHGAQQQLHGDLFEACQCSACS